ncbi:MAG: penicillin-binding protein 2 [Gemmatimonadetes bacterium]|jgi:penicillin-binding protein 2|nr:penicillin-binding protein 2 [Gemmatimonadota bacterium]MCC7322468.1 penicillin-binding protein 2 [Gemmatimonadaceae bacterium]MBK6841893.1 penicillin-binding protein 2 [Gemmatimonadota bacterium]MBK7835597.1 penicillin-binding protein 2 [Gemmatimonadota bacterium]MBK8061990.1 penicillin-binding protein 2 [Gemmatimonadota bacterium]
MSLHPNDIQRRGRFAGALVTLSLVLLASGFFRAQVLESARYQLSSEKNRLREVPIPAARGTIYDRHGDIIAENVPGYAVSILAAGADSLRATLQRLSAIIELAPGDIESAVRRLRRDPNRPTVVLADASFDQVSVLEEHRTEFPSLIIEATPKRRYPDGPAVSAFVGYTAEISESELNSTEYTSYKSGQQIGRSGLEQQYEKELRGTEGSRYVEVDARGRVVRDAGSRPDREATAAPALQTNIDLDLQRFVASYLADSLVGGVVAIEPQSGAVLAIHSSPAYDPNRFIGGIPAPYYRELLNNPGRPLLNKAIQGRYPPASTFKLATAAMALEEGLVDFDSRMPVPCTGGYTYGSRYFRCWDKKGHGSVTLSQAIAKSCDSFFYQLGLRMTLSKMLAGGVQLKFREKSGIDLPNETTPQWPYAVEYFNKRYGPKGWTNAVTLNLSIGQGENTQTILNMARFYTALATDGSAARPEVVRRSPDRTKILNLTPAQLAGLRDAMADVVSGRGTAGSAAIQGVVLAGKTGTAQNETGKDHAWFVGFAPKDDPKIVVAVMLWQGEHGYAAARIASKVVEHYLKRPAIQPVDVEGDD